MKSRKCGDFPWKNRWFEKQNKKPPKYFCSNCRNLFRTGKFSRFDSDLYGDICPNCGAPGLNLEELAEEYMDYVDVMEEILDDMQKELQMTRSNGSKQVVKEAK